MVSLNSKKSSKSIEQYIIENTKDSLLLQSFCAFIFEELDTFSEEKLVSIKQSRKDYKHIATQGYLLNLSDTIVGEFRKGTEWLMGRNFTDNDPIVHDNVALLGLIVGVKNSKDKHDYKNVINWINRIILLKPTYERSVFTHFFENLLHDNVDEIFGEEFNVELQLLNVFLQGKIPTESSYVSKYYLKLRIKSFPSNEDNFFREIVSVYNENKIIESYILNQEALKNEIKNAVNNEKIKIILMLKNNLDRKAKDFASITFLLYIVSAILLFIFISNFILENDWNFLEPRTYIIGFPLLPYIINAIYVFITERELSLSPKAVMTRLETWKQGKLYKEFSLESEN